MGTKKNDPVMKELCKYPESLSATDYTSERDLCDLNQWCYTNTCKINLHLYLVELLEQLTRE